MNNDLEFQRRQLWIEKYISLWQNEQDVKDCINSADAILAEFDKRFPQQTQSGMMGEDEFKVAIYSKYFGECKSSEEFYLGALAAHKLLTGKE